MNFQSILDDIDAAVRPLLGAPGQVDHYLPALARVSPLQFGIALRTRDGRHPYQAGVAVVTERHARRVNALMLTCGTYDAAGEFAYRIGLPCKSGSGSGNSLLGMHAQELFAARTGLSIF